MPRTERARLPSLPAEVPQFVIDKADELLKQLKLLGHPRAVRQDIVGALVDAATIEDVVAAVLAYNPKLGKALAELED